MTIPVLDYYRLKPEFLPEDIEMMSVYVRPGELETHIDAIDRWELVGRTFHPNKMQAADVEHHGFCVRTLKKARMKSFYKTRH